MRLCTECHWDGWDRIVDIYTDRCDSVPAYINDDANYKIIILRIMLILGKLIICVDPVRDTRKPGCI